MSRHCRYRHLILGVCLGFVPAAALAATAARVEFVVGQVSATSPAGQTRPLAKGNDVDSGDTVNTRDGRVQLRFTDGAYVSLQPQTLFRVDDYRYDGKADGNERGFFSLLKGGLRTITGLVGRTNKRNYRVSTTVATIGIRGTEYTIAYANGVAGSVGEGQIDVCNGGGCLPVTSGQSFFVAGNDIRPEISSKKTDLPPNQPGDVHGGKFSTANDPSKINGQSTLPSFVSGDQTTQTGDPSLLLVLTGSQMLSVVTGGTPGFLQQTGVFLDANGAATTIDLTPSSSPNSPNVLTFPSGLDQFGNDGIIAWGRGSGELLASPHYVHYITGLPTPLTDLTALQANRTIATYSVIGATTPTADVNGSTVFNTGTFQSASLTANFGLGKVDASVNFAMAGISFIAKSQMSITNGSLFINPQSVSGNSCTASSGSCNVAYMAGFFAGPAANRAGLVYDVSTHSVTPASCPTSPCAATSIKGTAAFVKN